MENVQTLTAKKPANRTIRMIYGIFAAIFVLCILVQVLLAGMAIFSGTPWSEHTNFVHFFEFIPFIMLILAFVGRLRHGLRWWPILLYAFIAFQYASAHLSGKLIAAFHPVAAIILFVCACYVTLRSWKYDA